MPVLVLSDLHLDRWLAAGRDPFAMMDDGFWSGLDALIIAGDLSDKPKVRWPGALAHVARYVSPDRIYVFPGNHDLYHHVLDGEARLTTITTAAGVHYAQKRQVIVGDTRFLCCTLWTDFAVNGDAAAGAAAARTGMNDYRYIRMETARYRKIWPEDTLRVHHDHLGWLEDKLATDWPGRTVVVTHHGPIPGITDPADRATDPAYASDLSATIARFSPDAWLFGHTHLPVTVTVGTTSVRNVSLGYPEQVTDADLETAMSMGLVET